MRDLELQKNQIKGISGGSILGTYSQEPRREEILVPMLILGTDVFSWYRLVPLWVLVTDVISRYRQVCKLCVFPTL